MRNFHSRRHRLKRAFPNRSILSSKTRPVRRRAAYVGLVAAICLTGSLFAGESLVLDFPRSTSESASLPVGLAAWPVESSKGLATLEIPLLAINQEGSLLATVVFRDDEGSIIHASWQDGGGKKTTLVTNLSEGIKGWNQRTLKISPELLRQAGKLIFEADAEIQPIKRVALAWTWPTGVFMSPQASAVQYVADTHRVYTDRELETSQPGPTPDTWSSGIWKAFLQEKPEPLDQDLNFSFPMEATPGTAILRAKVLGFPLNATVPIWVNGHKVDALNIETPDLTAAGYYKSGQKLSYAGWREAAIAIPAEYFQAGGNAVMLKAQKGAYIKDAQLELSFEQEGAPLAIADGTDPAAKQATGPAVISVPTQTP